MPWPRTGPPGTAGDPRAEAVSRGRSSRGGNRLEGGRNRTLSSRRWLERQLSDPYVAEAHRQGYRARSAFKLIELDERFRLLAPGQRVVDLGAAPGGWSQVAVERVAAVTGSGRVVAADLLPIEPLPGVRCLQLDLFDATAAAAIRDALDGPADVVLSDMAPAASGHAASDHLRSMALAEVAFEFARSMLAPGGRFVCKVWQGGTEAALLAEIKRTFAFVRHAKPPASRAGSREIFLVATGFRGEAG